MSPAPILDLATPHALFSRITQTQKTLTTTLPGTSKTVFLEYTTTTTPDPQYLHILSKLTSTTIGQWLTAHNPPQQPTTPDHPFPQAVRLSISRAYEVFAESFEQWRQKLVFIYIVQGMSGMAKYKIVVAADAQAAAAGMVQEACNGFSVVFSGAVHRVLLGRILQGNGKTVLVKAKQVVTWQGCVQQSEMVFEEGEGASFEWVIGEAGRITFPICC